jgi:hypothetical protein
MATAFGDTRPEWGEEQLRYLILRAVYDRVGRRCDRPVSGTEIGTVLDLRYEELFRVVAFLEQHGYLDHLGESPHVCITPRGIHYIEEVAGRRRSIRVPDVQPPT